MAPAAGKLHGELTCQVETSKGLQQPLQKEEHQLVLHVIGFENIQKGLIDKRNLAVAWMGSLLENHPLLLGWICFIPNDLFPGQKSQGRVSVKAMFNAQPTMSRPFPLPKQPTLKAVDLAKRKRDICSLCY